MPGNPLPLSPVYFPRDSIPSGTQLPLVPKFKGDATVRYSFPLGDDIAGTRAGRLHLPERGQLAPVAV